jgi:type IV pilus assembly protein PilQ
MNIRLVVFLLCFLGSFYAGAQETRLLQLENAIGQQAQNIKGLQESVELDLSNTDVHTLLTAVAKVHEINMVISPELRSDRIENTFNELQVATLLMYLAKEYSLTYEFTGNIIAVKKYREQPVVINTDRSEVNYELARDYLSLDLNNAVLEDVFREITNQSGKNLLYDNSIRNRSLSIYLREVPLEKALQQLALGNGLLYEKTNDGFYLFSPAPATADGSPGSRVARQRGRRFEYTIIDTLEQQLNVNFKEAMIEDVILNIAEDLDLGIYVASPLENAGTANIKAKSISFEELLTKLFESREQIADAEINQPNIQQANGGRNNQGLNANPSSGYYTFKREGNLFFFGTSDQLTTRTVKLIPLKYRAIEIIQDQQIQNSNRFSTNQAFNTGSFSVPGVITNQGFNNGNIPGNNQNRVNNNLTPQTEVAQVISDMLPDEVISTLDIKIDKELNSFVVNGPAAEIAKFERLVNSIDKPVPVILIETMIIEINRTSTVETGIEWGLGNGPVNTTGNIYPNTDLTLGANSVNRILGGIEGFASLNLGRVVPNFFARLKAMETNGEINIQSAPKLSVLNGHEANLAIGETTYYVITSRDIIGAQNPQTQIIENFQPIDAELGVYIKPVVSENGEITMGIVVNQSTFTGTRISEEAPPDITSRQFTSTIRAKDKDIVILGGLEESIRSNTGSGVPFLARIPIIKFLFSKRVREGTKRKLAILIRPTVLR